ncbi:uncharacterized protein CLUP02_04065, partial [Colletotrichum lupini]
AEHASRHAFWKPRGYVRRLLFCILAWNGTSVEDMSSTGASTIHCRPSVSPLGTRSANRLEMKLGTIMRTTPWKSWIMFFSLQLDQSLNAVSSPARPLRVQTRIVVDFCFHEDRSFNKGAICSSREAPAIDGLCSEGLLRPENMSYL